MVLESWTGLTTPNAHSPGGAAAEGIAIIQVKNITY